MNTELHLLKILSKHESFFRFKNIVKPHTLSKDARIIFECFEDYWKYCEDDKDINWFEFATWFRLIKYPIWKEEKLERFTLLFNQLENLQQIEHDQVKEIIETFISIDYSLRIVNVANKIIDGEPDVTLEEVEEILDEYHRESKRSTNSSMCLVTDNMEDLFYNISEGGLEWRLEELNISIGPLRQSNFVLVSARPESGKTTLLASEASFMAQQSERPVLWFNNEEDGKAVYARIIQATLGWDTRRLHQSPTTTMESYNKIFSGDRERIKVFDLDSAHNHYIFITKMIARYEPSLIIIDQLRKVRGFEKQSVTDINRLAHIYGWGRDIAKEFAPVITAHQARGDAEGIKWINRNQLEGSQTEIQGELDVQIMMGRSLERGEEDNRYLNIVKNKLPGGPRSDVTRRHGQWVVQIIPELARFKGGLKHGNS